MNTLSDFENCHMSATHTISQIGQQSQSRISRELKKKFDIPGLTKSQFYFFDMKKSLTLKSYAHS